MTEVATLIIGAGVTGVALARELARRGVRGIAVLDQEPDVAVHASGRNSGVLHAGYNPRPGTLKARLCVEGNRKIKELSRDRGVPLREGGILIVAVEPAEAPRLEELLERGRSNGVPGLRRVEAGEIPAIEPNAAGLGGLHAPSGASVDARALVRALAEEARERGVAFLLGRRAARVEETASGFEVEASGERIRCARLVNCAGLGADLIAHALGAGLDYGMVPVRGEYRWLRPELSGLVRSMVYPVPRPDFPFLGVHWTKTTDGRVKIGPNAVPALGREAYSWRASSLRGALELATDRRAWRLLASPGFPALVAEQLRTSLSARRFAAAARALVPALRDEDLEPGPGPSGIRAQLVDRRGRMVDDLVIEERGAALHVLNVVSPGLTCSLAFAEVLADRLGR